MDNGLIETEQLMQAIKAKDTNRVQALLERQPQLASARDAQGNSPILLARYYGAHDIIGLLLARGVPLSVHEAAAVGQSAALLSLLGESPELADSFSHDGYTPLGLAAFFGHADIAAELLQRGADVHAASRNEMRVTPLHSAAAGRHAAIAHALLEHGADANARQQSGWTPLHSAVHNRHAELAALLLAHGADAHAANDAGATPLSMARELGDAQLERLLARPNDQAGGH
ncbi:ankyrin repeat domain-containing protein [Paenibacillus piri]|nr:ankyrin repeat domain-containing protein [Paenibacillus piri]